MALHLAVQEARNQKQRHRRRYRSSTHLVRSAAVLPVSGRGGGLRTASRNDGIAALALGVGARGHGTQRRGRQGRVRGVPCGARGRRGRYAARAGLRSRVPRGVHPGVVASEHDVPALPRRRRTGARSRTGSTVRQQRVTVSSTVLSPRVADWQRRDATRCVALRCVANCRLISVMGGITYSHLKPVNELVVAFFLNRLALSCLPSRNQKAFRVIPMTRLDAIRKKIYKRF